MWPDALSTTQRPAWHGNDQMFEAEQLTSEIYRVAATLAICTGSFCIAKPLVPEISMADMDVLTLSSARIWRALEAQLNHVSVGTQVSICYRCSWS